METISLWDANLGNGTYRNPILHADYSDPDAIRFGETYYMTASSFNYTPGLPILRSFDLVNWELVNYAIKNIDYPDSVEDADGVHEVVKADMPLICEQGCIWFRGKIRDGEKVTAEFSFSTDGKNYQVLPEAFVLLSHTWVGAKTGIFSIAQDCQEHQGYADFEYVEYHNIDKALS